MKARVKRGRPVYGDALDKTVHVSLSEKTLEKIESIRAAQEIGASQSAIVRHLISKGIDAVEKEAARG